MCNLQIYFAETHLIQYFVINMITEAANVNISDLKSEKTNFFQQLNKNVAVTEKNVKAKVSTVHSFDSHRSAVML